MKKKIFTSVFYLITLYIAKSQNLVPNYSFEQITKCPTWLNQIDGYATFWSAIGAGSFAFYDNTCDTSGGPVGVPLNTWGYQHPHTGNGYVGIFTFVPLPPPSAPYDYDFRDYIQVKLIDTLQARKRYYVTFYVSLADSSKWACDNIGAYFSDSLLANEATVKSYLTPQVENDTAHHLIDKINWMRISGNFIAKGGESYIAIGNFIDDKHSDSIFVGSPSSNSGHNWNNPYYYIDDVIVSLDSNYADSLFSSVQSINKPEGRVNIYPNPSNAIVTIQYLTQAQTKEYFSLYDIMGQQVEIFQLKEDETTISVSGLTTGIYLYRILTNDEKLVQTGKLIIEH